MPPSFFSAALSTWRAVHAPLPGTAVESASLDAIVKLSIKALPDARTAETLGAEREGTGVVIDENGLILTIGYLMLEAGSVLVMTSDGRVSRPSSWAMTIPPDSASCVRRPAWRASPSSLDRPRMYAR
jgi:hypothetical protein